jgi:polyhydroxyalkanoate synthesis regulator phasin
MSAIGIARQSELQALKAKIDELEARLAAGQQRKGDGPTA